MERSPAPSGPDASDTNDTPDLPSVAEALSKCVREALEHGEPTDVPGLGTFRIEHRASQVEESAGGERSLSPPRDEIVFEPARE
jgi:nucleoid DNA-binding protein